MDQAPESLHDRLATLIGADAATHLLAMEDIAQRLIDGERGGFARALAIAWRHGDGHNRLRIELAFPELFCEQ